MSLIDDDAGAAQTNDADSLVAAVEQLGSTMERVRQGVSQVIFGQSDVVEQSLITLLAGGHMLLIGVPGLAKTRLVETLGQVIGLDERRIQCTPDLCLQRNRRKADRRDRPRVDGLALHDRRHRAGYGITGLAIFPEPS